MTAISSAALPSGLTSPLNTLTATSSAPCHHTPRGHQAGIEQLIPKSMLGHAEALRFTCMKGRFTPALQHRRRQRRPPRERLQGTTGRWSWQESGPALASAGRWGCQPGTSRLARCNSPAQWEPGVQSHLFFMANASPMPLGNACTAVHLVLQAWSTMESRDKSVLCTGMQGHAHL